MDVTGLEAGAKWSYTLDGGNHWTEGSGASIPASAFGGDGQKFVYISQEDMAGNSMVSNALYFTLDTYAAPPSLSRDIRISGRTQSKLTVSGLEGGATWQYQVDGGIWQKGTGTSFDLSSGSHTYSVKQIDLAGNVSTTTVLNTDSYVAKLGNPSIDGIISRSWNDPNWHFYNSYYEPAALSRDADLRIALGSGVMVSDVIKIFGGEARNNNPTYQSLEYRDAYGIAATNGAREDTVYTISQDDLNRGFVDMKQFIGDVSLTTHFFKAALYDSTGSVQLSDFTHDYRIFK